MAAIGRNRGGAILARFGVGHDGIDKPLARKHGIVVTNTPGALDISVAEHAIWLMGNLARHVSSLESRFRRGRFEPCGGIELHGRSLGIIGFGAIGRRVARMAHFGLRMNVLAVDPRSPAELETQEHRPLSEILAAYGVSLYTSDLEIVLGQADIVSLHLPSIPRLGTSSTPPACLQMKPTALVINTARGAVLDENALYDALAAGQIGGAALDVFETEPYQPASPGKDADAREYCPHTAHRIEHAGIERPDGAGLPGEYRTLLCRAGGRIVWGYCGLKG